MRILSINLMSLMTNNKKNKKYVSTFSENNTITSTILFSENNTILSFPNVPNEDHDRCSTES